MVNSPKGWVTDVHPMEQPENSYRYALNAVREMDAGDRSLVINERGTVPCNINLGGEPIGSLYISENEFVVFLASNEIGVVKDCVYESILKDDCLNFSPTHAVDATFRVRGCDRIVYYTDGYNPPRVINLDDPKCELLIPLDRPVEATAFVIVGGNLAQGSYQLAIRYMDADQNPSNWSWFAGPYVIYSGNNYREANGEFNATTRPLDNIPSSNKSIRVSVQSNDKPLYQIALGQSISSSGSIDRVFLSRPTAIGSTTIIGGNFESWTETIVEEIFIDRLTVATAQSIDQLENRLVLANITESQRQYCGYQLFANQIVTKPIVRKTAIALLEGNARHYDQSQAGYMGDDVYMFGIVYVFSDGSQSPVFHIPGRAKLPEDGPLTIVGFPTNASQIAYSEVLHLGLQPDTQVDAWRVRNSGNADRFGYWEGNNLYPDTLNCDGTPLFGDLAGQPIRGHRFPSRNTIPHVDSDYTYSLGVNFDNVVYPDSDIVGHFFVRAKTEFPTVTQTAYFLPTYNNFGIGQERAVGDFFYYSQDLYGSSASDATAVYALTPNTLFNLPTDYQYIVKYLRAGHIPGVRNVTTEDGVIGYGTNIDFTADFYYTRLDSDIAPITYENLAYRDRFRLDPRIEEEVNGIRFKNYSNTIPYEVVRIDGSMGYDYFGGGNTPNNQTRNALYCGLKSTVDPYPSLPDFQYVRISPFTLAVSQDVFGGDTFVCSVSVMNVADVVLRRNIANTVREVTWKGTLASDVYWECRFNTSLNYRTDDYFEPSVLYLEPPQPNQSFDSGRQFVFNYALTRNDDNDFVIRDVADYIYDFNNDMTVRQRMREYFPLPAFYDCCDKCVGRFPFRIVYSQQSFQEEAADNFRVFLANNYRDIEGNTGQITDIHRMGEELLVVTSDSVWYLPSNVQERVSDAGIVSYLGSGEFFAIPPRIVVDRIGKVEKWATINTPAGVIIVDSLFGRVYNVSKQAEPVEGIESELRRIMGRTLADLFGIRSSYRIGTQSVYDDEYKRVIFTHKDYTPLVPIGGSTDGKTGQDFNKLYYDLQSSAFYVVMPGFGPLEVGLDSSQYFCNRSFTVSLSLQEGWVGYHSYVPQMYLGGKKLLMAVNNNHLHRHNTGDYCVYYSIEYPHALEQVFKTKGIDSVSFITYATENGRQMRWTTFDRAVVYNSYQSTQERVLVSKNNLEGEFYLQNSALQSYLLDTYEESFSINGFRDEVGNYDVSVFVDSCIDLRLGNKLLNPLAFTGKDWFERQPFTDNYVQVRLFFSPHPKVRLASLIFQIVDEAKGRNRRQ